MTAPAWTVKDGHLLLTVRLTPNAREEGIEGIRVLADGKAVLAVRVRAVPENGAANDALEKRIARAMGVAKSRVSLVAGATQRVKIVRIDGDAADLAAQLQALVAAG